MARENDNNQSDNSSKKDLDQLREKIRLQRESVAANQSQVDKALELFKVIRDMRNEYGELDDELKNQLKSVTDILKQNQQQLKILEALENKEKRLAKAQKDRADAEKSAMQKSKQAARQSQKDADRSIHDAKELETLQLSIGRTIGKNTKLYKDGQVYNTQMHNTLESVNQTIKNSGKSQQKLRQESAGLIDVFKGTYTGIQKANLEFKKGTIDATERISTIKSLVDNYKNFLSQVKLTGKAGQEVFDILEGAGGNFEDIASSIQKTFDASQAKEAAAAAKAQAKQTSRDIAANIHSAEELEKVQRTIGNRLGKNSKLYEQGQLFNEQMHATLTSVNKVIQSSGKDQQKLANEIQPAIDAYKEYYAGIQSANLARHEGKMGDVEHAETVKQLEENYYGVLSALKLTGKAAEDIFAILTAAGAPIKQAGDAAAATSKHFEAIDSAMDELGKSGIPIASELSEAISSLGKDAKTAKIAFMALGAAVGALIGKIGPGFAQANAYIKAQNEILDEQIELRKELAKLGIEGGFIPSKIALESTENQIQGQMEVNKLAREGQFNASKIANERLQNEYETANNVNRAMIDAQHAAERAAVAFNQQMKSGAAAFKASAKTALFGGNLGDVKMNVAQLQLAGITSEEIANSLSDASETLGKMPTAAVGAQMSVFAKRSGAATSDIAEISNMMELLDGASLDTSLNLQEGMKALADKAGISFSGLMKGIASASKKMADYGVKNSKQLAKSVAFAKSLGTSYETIMDAGKNMVLNYQDSIKAEMQLSALLGKQVDLSEVRQRFYENDMEGAVSALRDQGLNPEDMDVFDRDALSKALGGMDLNALMGINKREGANVSDVEIVGQKIEDGNQKFLDAFKKAQQELSAKEARISADTAIIDAELSGKITDAYLNSAGYLKYQDNLNTLSQKQAELTTKIANDWLNSPENLKYQQGLNSLAKQQAELNAAIEKAFISSKQYQDYLVSQERLDTRKDLTENIIPLVTSLIGGAAFNKIGGSLFGGAGAGAAGAGAAGAGAAGAGAAGAGAAGAGAAGAGAGGAGAGGGLTGMLGNISPGAISNLATGLAGVVGVFQGYSDFNQVRQGEKEVRTTDKMGAGVVQGGLAVAGAALGTAFGGPLGTMIGGFLGNTLGKWINKNAPGFARMVGGMFEGIRDSFKEVGKVWDSTKEKFGQLFEKFQPAIDWVNKGINSIASALGFEGEGLGGIMRFVAKTVWDVVLTPFRVLIGAFGLVADIVGVVIKLFKGDFKGAWADFKNAFSDFFGGILEPFDNIWFAIKKGGAKLFNWFATSWLGEAMGMQAIDIAKMDRDRKAELDAKAAEEKKKRELKEAEEAKKAQQGGSELAASQQFDTNPYPVTPQYGQASIGKDMSKADIEAIQKSLIMMGEKIVADGIWGPKTQAAYEKHKPKESPSISNMGGGLPTNQIGFDSKTPIKITMEKDNSGWFSVLSDWGQASSTWLKGIFNLTKDGWEALKTSQRTLIPDIKTGFSDTLTPLMIGLRDGIVGAINRLLVYQKASVISAETQNKFNEFASGNIKSINSFLNFPAYAKGTSGHPGGMALVGEEGPELVNLPKGTEVIPHNQSKELVNRFGISGLSGMVPAYADGTGNAEDNPLLQYIDPAAKNFTLISKLGQTWDPRGKKFDKLSALKLLGISPDTGGASHVMDGLDAIEREILILSNPSKYGKNAAKAVSGIYNATTTISSALQGSRTAQLRVMGGLRGMASIEGLANMGRSIFSSVATKAGIAVEGAQAILAAAGDMKRYGQNTNIMTGDDPSAGRLAGNYFQLLGAHAFDTINGMTFGLFDKYLQHPEFLLGPLGAFIPSLSDGGLSPRVASASGVESARMRNMYFTSNPNKPQGYVSNKDLAEWFILNANEISESGADLFDGNDGLPNMFKAASSIIGNIEKQKWEIWKKSSEADRKKKFNPLEYSHFTNKDAQHAARVRAGQESEAKAAEYNRMNLDVGSGPGMGYDAKMQIKSMNDAQKKTQQDEFNKKIEAQQRERDLQSWIAYSNERQLIGTLHQQAARFVNKGTTAPSFDNYFTDESAKAFLKQKGIKQLYYKTVSYLGGGPQQLLSVSKPNDYTQFNTAGWFTVPAYAKGIDSAPGGMAMVGEKGSEMMLHNGMASMVGVDGPEIRYVPKGAEIVPNQKLPAMAEGTIGATAAMMTSNTQQLMQLGQIIADAISSKQEAAPAQNINLLVDGRQLANVQYRRQQNRLGMRPNDLV